MASPSGDGGRDSELFSPEGEPHLVFQYSVQIEWDAKIRQTIKRLKDQFPTITSLTYVTNQVIGARSDKVRRYASKVGIHLDIMDRSWFLDRSNTDQHRTEAASSLARAIVDPLLETRQVASAPSRLTSSEANTALLYLELQRQDEVAGKNLTRSSFEALVRAALQGSDRDSRVSRAEVYKRVNAFVPQHSETVLKAYVDAALNRLKRGAVSEWGDDTFHLSHTEVERLKDSSAKLLLMRGAFERDVTELVQTSTNVVVPNLSSFLDAVRQCIETYFLKRGEEFASAVTKNAPPPMNDVDLKQVVTQFHTNGLITGRDASGYLLYVVSSILARPSSDTLQYLKLMSDSYTLLSFLSETPDVQTVTKKLFSHGNIWLDTSVLLPLFPETLLPEHLRPFTAIFAQCRKASAKLFVTPGIVEEIERHLNLSLTCARSTRWEGMTPYVLARYIFAGKSKSSFASWLETFMGNYRPVEDIAEYLGELGIIVQEPDDAGNVPGDVRQAIVNYWQDTHDKRRGAGDEGFNLNVDRLARHDAENALTVIAERLRQTGKSGLGYASWWLALDRAAFRMAGALEKQGLNGFRHSPVISLDFLIKYLSFGPARDQVQTTEHAARVFASTLIEQVPAELIALAEQVRADCAGMEERVIQRRIRDALDQAKSEIGTIHQGGLDKVDEAILASF